MKISLFANRLMSSNYINEKECIDLNNLLDEVGYHGALFVYHSKSVDYLIPIARYMNKNHNFKYIIAIRTYAISPEYLAMIIRSFDKIQQNRIALNIVAGDIHSDEEVLKNSVLISDLIDTTEKRTKYTEEWLKKFIPLVDDLDIDIIISGYSENSNNNAKLYAKEQLCMLCTYIEEVKDKIECEGKMVSFPVYLTEYDLLPEELEEYKSRKELDDMLFRSMISGTESEVIEKILNLKNIGVTHCLINIPFVSQEQEIHTMAKKLINML